MSFLHLLSFCLLVVNCVVSEDHNDGGKAPRIPLNDGNYIPTLGLGTFLGFDNKGLKAPEVGEVEAAVLDGLLAGYRLVDTAQIYMDEDQVGLGIKKSGLPREDLYIVTKLSPATQRDAVAALKESLIRLDTPYVDLYLIHNPISFKPNNEYDIVDYVDTWKQMEEAKKLGLAKSIGISNFNISQIERLLENSEIKPSVLQVEVNLNLAQDKLIEFCKSNGIVVMAYTPFGSIFSKDPASAPFVKVDDPILVEIAEKYKKTVPQVILRYLVQRGLVPIPKSVHKDRLEQNIDVFDFELTAEEMDALSKFNKDIRTVNISFWQDHPYYPFEKQEVPRENPFKAIGLKD